MDFKERFKGRSTTVSKEGVISTLAAPSMGVQKTGPNNALNSSAQRPVANIPTEFQDGRNSYSKMPHENQTSHKPVMPAHSDNHFYSRTPVHQHQQVQDSPNYPKYHPSNSAPNTGNKNPYFVSNPFPPLDSLDNYSNNPHNNSHLRQYNNPGMYEQERPPQEAPVSYFNPNSFYNQHSQYKNPGPVMTPKREGSENQPIYKATSTSQLVKQNFENLSQQNKQKRGKEQPVRAIDPNYRPPHSSNNRIEGNYNYPNYNNYDQGQYEVHSPPPHMHGYHGPRDIHSNPVPHQGFQSYGNFPQNLTYQFDRGHYDRGQDNHSVPHRQNGGQPTVARSLSNTGSGYKPMTMKEVKDSKGKPPVQLGGLGPNTNTDEWFKQKEKKDKMAEFSQNVKLFNAQRISNTETNFKVRREKEKEKSRREIALEFARNIPKPRVRNNQEEDYAPHQQGYEEDEQDYDHMNPNELDDFELRHRQHKAQLGKMNLY